MKKESITAYPLCWPQGVARADVRERALFNKKRQHEKYSFQTNQRLTVADGYRRLDDELWRLLSEHEYQASIVSTNIELKRDGTPYSRRRAPEDPGAAVYFTMGGVEHCLPCDKWDSVADNLAAIAAHIAALRGIDRWGVGTVKQAFYGFRMLPEQGSGTPWHSVLGVSPDASAEDIRKAYRKQAKETHPDRGGSKEDFQRVQDALGEGLAAINGQR